MSGIRAKSNDTLIVEARLRETQIGDVVTYEELSKLLGRDVREFCIGSIATARKTLQGESIFFDTISKVGYKRLNNEEACTTATHYVRRARSTSMRGMRHLQNVPFESLQPETKKKHLALSAQLGAITLFGSSASEKKITTKIQGTSPISIGETLSLFTDAKK